MKLDALVIQKRLSCDDDCSYQVRLKRYREQRQNLGELNRLARVRLRPVFTPASPTVLPKVVEAVASTQSISDNPSKPTRPTVEEDIEADDEWFELSRKRMFEGDGVGYIKRLQTANRREGYEAYERHREEFYANLERLRREAEELNNEVERKQANDRLQKALNEFRELRIREMRANIFAYDTYRGTTDDEGSSVRVSMDEYYDLLREDVGTLEQLRN